MRMQVAISEQDGSQVVAVRGEIDLDSSPDLWNELRGALREARPVLVDLREVNYIDSSGVAVLIQGLKHASKAGTTYRLRDPSPRVMAVLELAQLPKLFDIERTDSEA